MRESNEMTAAEIDAVSGGSLWSWVQSWFTPAKKEPVVYTDALVVKG